MFRATGTIALILFAAFAFANPLVAQTREVQNASEAVNKVLEDSGKHFREGLTALKANRRQDSGLNFDKSVEVFLSSAINIQTDGRLQTCYSHLLETVFRIEFPRASKEPRIRSLVAICGWQWNDVDLGLADEVTALVAQTKTADIATAQTQVASDEPVGFNSQGFEPSPLGELLKLELLPEELEIDSSSIFPSFRTVIARPNDTIGELSNRHGANAIEVAKLNGLLPSSRLGAGRKIRLPVSSLGGKLSVSSEPDSTDLLNRSRYVCVGGTEKLIVQKLSLGMSRSEIIRLHPKRFVFRGGFFSGQQYGVATNLPGVLRIELSTYQDNLYSIYVLYDSSIKWSGIDEFQKAVSGSLGVAHDWITVNSRNPQVACEGTQYLIELRENLGNYTLALKNDAMFSKMLTDHRQRTIESARRKALEEERKKKAFKP